MVVGPGGLPRLAKSSRAAKPVVAGVAEDLTALDEAARELVAVKSVLEHPTVEEDWVARQEVSERIRPGPDAR